jgi:hypothetical protein
MISIKHIALLIVFLFIFGLFIIFIKLENSSNISSGLAAVVDQKISIVDNKINEGTIGKIDDGIDDTVTAIVDCETTFGSITIDVRNAWAPLG